MDVWVGVCKSGLKDWIAYSNQFFFQIQLFRNDCFGSRFFYGCMEALLVKDELKTGVAAYLDDFHTR